MSDVDEHGDPGDVSPADAALLARLGDALGADPMPTGVVARAEGLLGYLDLDADLAALLDAPTAELAGMRGTAGAVEQLVFEHAASGVSVEIVLERSALAGQVLAGDVSEVTLVSRDGERSTPVDDLGRFRFADLPPGRARLRLRAPAHSVDTDWFSS